MIEPTRNEWMTFSEALEGYLEAREAARTTHGRRQEQALAEMRDCAAQMDYLVSRVGNDEHK